MFLKPFRIRSQTSIKGSDRKKLRAEIAKQFPSVSEDVLKELIPNKEEMTMMKIYTHGGEGVIVYCLGKEPAFFTHELNRLVFPTVYTLWKFPELMPVMITWPPVLQKMSKGADLMLPGVILTQEPGPKAIPFRKGEPVAVKLLGNRSPVAVGITAMSGEDMYFSAMRGKGVILSHCVEDYLWAHGSKTQPPNNPDVEILELMEKNKQTYDEDDLEEEEKEIPAEDNGATKTDVIQDGMENLDLEDGAEAEGSLLGAEGGDEPGECESLTVEKEVVSKEDMDALLEACFLCGIKSGIKKSDLPILTSKFFKSHMQPFCPRDQNLDVKKSTYKKLGKFLSAMVQKGYVNIKELSKGVESITEVHKDHPDVRSFCVPDIPEPIVTEDSSSGDSFHPPTIQEMFTVTSATLPVFSKFHYHKGQAVSLHQLREVLTNYVKDEELDTKIKGQVTLDPILTDLLLNKGEAQEHMRWDTLFTRCQHKMSPAIQITPHGGAPVIRKGKLEPVTLNVVQRAGNKKVTLIHNLETFGIIPEEFGHTVQKGVACSATCSQLPGKGKGKEVLVQGNQINYIAQLLIEKYQLPKKYISGLDKAPKGKR